MCSHDWRELEEGDVYCLRCDENFSYYSNQEIVRRVTFPEPPPDDRIMIMRLMREYNLNKRRSVKDERRKV